MLPLLLAVFILVAAVLLTLVIRAARFGERPHSPPPAAMPPINSAAAALRLAEVLHCPTVSGPGPEETDTLHFQELQAILAKNFPRVHARMKRETVSGSLLFTWTGSEPELRPVLFMAHQDVVPAAAEREWTHPPFAGVIDDGLIWGRGALDMKSALTALLEAAEALLTENFSPRRSLLFAFGHDEEVGGRGNQEIAELLRTRGVRLELVLDEGGAVLDGIIPGLKGRAALVGIAEKGYLGLELTVHGEGGHSSLPPARTAVGALAEAIRRLEEAPFPSRRDFVLQLFRHLGRRLPFAQRLLFANPVLFPLAERRLARSPVMNSALRTTAVPTLLQAGIKENVLPESASMVLNLRLLPGDTADGATERVREILRGLPVQVRPLPMRSEPSPVADISSPAYALLARTICETMPQAAVAPYLVVAATDSRHYLHLAENILRFLPLRLAPQDLQRIHGTDERIAVEDYRQMIHFYRRLMINLQELNSEM